MKTMMNTSQLDENQLILERRAKLQAIREKGVAFPNDFRPTHQADTLHSHFGKSENTELQSIFVTIAGRMVLKRIMGKASFATLQDNGTQIQVYIACDSLGQTHYADFKHWDLGDILGVEGYLMKTKTDELTIRATTIRLLTKAIRPLPEKHHGLVDQETKYRQRYLDLITTPKSRETFIQRSEIIHKIREIMRSEGYIEVETPMMHPIPGGAAAKPFVTHHNALDTDLYLRIAPELYLKRLVIGGLESVFEINRSFRNEGMSTRHNPEFTMMEFYEAYADYTRMMAITEMIIKTCACAVIGDTLIEYQGRTLDLSKPFERLTVSAAILKYNPEYTKEQIHSLDWLRSEMTARGYAWVDTEGLASLQFALFEASTEEKLWDPTYIIDYPLEISPLARASDTEPEVTERFELFIAGREHANGFSELNDPEDQAKRFLAQTKMRESGNEEAMHYDADYIRALEYGLPPTAGCGIGIDRLVMLLTDSASIRDVILFPQMRREDL